MILPKMKLRLMPFDQMLQRHIGQKFLRKKIFLVIHFNLERWKWKKNLFLLENKTSLETIRLNQVPFSATSGLYYKHMTIINYASSVVNKLEALLTDDARVIIYNRHVFIIQATKWCYGLAHKYLTRLERLARDKHSSLLQKYVKLRL